MYLVHDQWVWFSLNSWRRFLSQAKLLMTIFASRRRKRHHHLKAMLLSNHYYFILETNPSNNLKWLENCGKMHQLILKTRGEKRVKTGDELESRASSEYNWNERKNKFKITSLKNTFVPLTIGNKNVHQLLQQQ